MIRIIPLGYVAAELVASLAEKLEDRFDFVGGVAVLNAVELPWQCYNSLRHQYNSTCILRHLESRWITLGVTEVDMYANGLNFVFGEAELGGSRAVVSTYRLKVGASRKLLEERLFKEAVHELGHVFGLRHCNDRRCVMCFSNSVSDVDAKSSEFCELCGKKIGRFL